MRCYFHLVSDQETILDNTGLEVIDMEMAAAQARNAIDELRYAHGGSSESWSGWRLEIICTEGGLLSSLDLEPALH